MGEKSSMSLLSEEFDADICLHELSQNSSKFCFVVIATFQSFTMVIEGIIFDLLYSNDKTTDVAFTLPTAVDTESTTYHTMAEDFRKHTVITTFFVTFVLVSLMIVVPIIVIIVISKRKRQWPCSLSKQSSNTLYE